MFDGIRFYASPSHTRAHNSRKTGGPDFDETLCVYPNHQLEGMHTFRTQSDR